MSTRFLYITPMCMCIKTHFYVKAEAHVFGTHLPRVYPPSSLYYKRLYLEIDENYTYFSVNRWYGSVMPLVLASLACIIRKVLLTLEHLEATTHVPSRLHKTGSCILASFHSYFHPRLVQIKTKCWQVED